jgi:hypothetical protein
MAGLVPAIHVLLAEGAPTQGVDARHKAGHDECLVTTTLKTKSPDPKARRYEE